MTSETLILRHDKVFRLLDSNANGYVEEADVKRIRDQILAVFGESPTSERGTAIGGLFDDYWQALLASATVDANGRIGSQQWREMYDRVVSDQATYDRIFTPLATAVFRLVDTDNDDKVGPAEWHRFQESMGNGDAAETSFQRLDTNDNGYLTVEELVVALHEYLTNPDPNVSGGWLLGEL